MAPTAKIIYTKTDEAPALATYSLLPIIEVFTKDADIEVEKRDISLAGRIIANFPEFLTESQRIPDALEELGKLAKTPEANIIKLPNISASIPQLKAAIKELQDKGYNLPEYPEEVTTPEDEKIRARYGKVLGSAVNPVLREGNSDRRVAMAVKQYAKKNPHKMGVWNSESMSHVAHMEQGDFYSTEQSTVIAREGNLKIELVDAEGKVKVLKEDVLVQEAEVVDAAVMSVRHLKEFYSVQIEKAKNQGLLFSLHLKATMMKVSDPILFGHAVSVYYADVLKKYQSIFDELGVDLKNGIGDLYTKIENLPKEKQEEITSHIDAVYDKQPELAMVNSDRGITNLHVPSDVIIDASMPAAIRESGQMWGSDGQLKDTIFTIPDRSYARIYQQAIDFHKSNGAFDVTTMGNVPNVGLMAQKAEEYGSHDKTFEIPFSGNVRVVDQDANVLMEHEVEKGDIWRMCQTRDLPIKDWVKLGVTRARQTGVPAVFWLDTNRAHDANLICKVNGYLKEHDISGLDIRILAPVDAMQISLERARDGKDTISVTGNVLRDYLTDLFPILELGTSAKMLSIVPLLAGGGLFETGAGGSAPKHVQQFVEEGHLRWDSLGEFLALAVSLEDLSIKTDSKKAGVLADTLNKATAKFLIEKKSPSRKVNELDNRGSHFYLALYWAEALAAQDDDTELKSRFSGLAETLSSRQTVIISELNSSQGISVDVGGYYLLDDNKADLAMRPSATFNAIISQYN